MPADFGQIWAIVCVGNGAHNIDVAILVQVVCLSALGVGVCVTRT